jgi:hypothetical protein
MYRTGSCILGVQDYCWDIMPRITPLAELAEAVKELGGAEGRRQ